MIKFVIENRYTVCKIVSLCFCHFIPNLLLTGTVDRLGRALIVAHIDASEAGSCGEEMARILACYHKITQ